MDDLNNKLHNIQVKFSDKVITHQDWRKEDIWEAIAQIHQAYKEAGYIDSGLDKETINQVSSMLTDLSAPVDKDGIINFGTEDNPVLIHELPFSPFDGGGYINIPKDLRLTGQEWFEKFCYEVLPEGGSYEEGDTVLYDKVMDAARKASGIL